MTARRNRRQSGYTIVEILVVVAIAAVIMALCIPLFQLALQKALNSKCMSNQHQIYEALQQFATENGGQLPAMLPLRASTSDTGPTLDTALAPYVTDPTIFHCPADKTVFAQSGCSYLWVYGYSVNALGQQNTTLASPSFPLLGLTDPTQIPYVSDKQSFHNGTPGSHMVYADGHVQ